MKRNESNIRGADLKARRKDMKMTQRQFAEWLGASHRAVVAWEGGQNPIPLWVERKLNERDLVINPSLPLDVVIAAKKAANAQGMNLETWIAHVMREALDKRSAPPAVEPD